MGSSPALYLNPSYHDNKKRGLGLSTQAAFACLFQVR